MKGGLCVGTFCGLIFGCSAAPQVKSTADYHPHELRKASVLLVPLAVSDALGDQRTGIILSDETRALASESTCSRLSAHQDPKVVCLDAAAASSDPALAQVELLFALDKPIPEDVWRTLRQKSGATHAVLFRPEGVSSSQAVSREATLHSPIVLLGGGALLATTAILSGMGAAATEREETSNETKLAYTVSASLVDLRSGKLLKVGLHSRSATREVKRNLGFAEPPPAAPILENLMVELGDALLDD